MKKIINLMALLAMILCLGSCGENEDKLEGCWERQESYEGMSFTHSYCFTKGSDTNYFTETLTPHSSYGIGFKVRGTWETDITDDLVIYYNVSSLEPLCGSMVSRNDIEVSTYLLTLKTSLMANNIQADDGAYIGLEFKGDDTMTLETTDGIETFHRAR